MFGLLKNRTYAIGVDITDDALRIVQLAVKGKSIKLIAGSNKNRPKNVKLGSAKWQRWAVEAMRQLTMNGKFHGRYVVAAIPANEVFIDHIKVGASFYDKSQEGNPKLKTNDGKLQQAVVSKIKQRLPFEPDDALIKYIPAEEDNVVVIAAERKIIDRHLAVYEKANLQIKSMGVWPIALTNSYTRFFGRRDADIKAIVMLLNIGTNYTNVVFCRHKNLLFARSIPIGTKQLRTKKMVTRLIIELTNCKRQFASMYKKARPERLVFLSGQAVDTEIYKTIAMQLEMAAQMGDCLAAVEMPASRDYSQIDRRNCNVDWATAFGLSLS